MGIKIRKYRHSDSEGVRSVTLLSFGPVSVDGMIEKKFGKIAGRSWKTRKAMDIRKDIGGNPSGTFVAVDGEKIAGYITASTDTYAKIGRIPNLAVHPGYKGQGIGTTLLKKALSHFKQKGMRLAKIETLSHNLVAAKLYKKLGFKEVTGQIHLAMKI